MRGRLSFHCTYWAETPVYIYIYICMHVRTVVYYGRPHGGILNACTKIFVAT